MTAEMPFLTPRSLLTITVAYNLGEGVVAVWAGIAAQSISLVAFGADSYLEVAAASLVLWRLSIADQERGERIERRVVRFIGVTFLLLAVAVMLQSVWNLFGGKGAEESGVGIALALGSLVVMPAISLLKLRAAAARQVPSLAAEARETIACSYLSFTLLLGLLANYLFGVWWLDPVTALLLVPWLIREGLEGVRGEASADSTTLCFCRGCLFGLRDCAGVCEAACAPACCVPASSA
jgi:divalent metal cation (Fe/Co/Zn/Cd) transporter